MQVSFRKVVEEDRARLLAWRNAPAVAPYMYADHLITHAEHDRWFDGVSDQVAGIHIGRDGGRIAPGEQSGPILFHDLPEGDVHSTPPVRASDRRRSGALRPPR